MRSCLSCNEPMSDWLWNTENGVCNECITAEGEIQSAKAEELESGKADAGSEQTEPSGPANPPRRKFTKEERQEIVEGYEAVKGNTALAQYCTDVGIAVSVLYRWRIKMGVHKTKIQTERKAPASLKADSKPKQSLDGLIAALNKSGDISKALVVLVEWEPTIAKLKDGTGYAQAAAELLTTMSTEVREALTEGV